MAEGVLVARSQKRVWICGIAAFLLLGTVGVASLWAHRPGCFTHSNYERIQEGMNREQVDELLGVQGAETKSIPGHPPYVQKRGYPPGYTGVVWGDTFGHWQDGYGDVYVGFVEGKVVSKWYYEPSL